MNTRAQAQSAGRDVVGFTRALIELTKPGVTRLVFVTALLGCVLAPGVFELGVAIITVLGTVLVVASANALNMYLERDVDALMTRTRNRPLPSGRLSRDVALSFGLALGVAGVVVLFLGVNALTAVLAAFALASYVWLYTPMKARSSWALYVGAIPGAMPPVLGYTGMTGTLDAQALSVFALLFVWQVPHFLAIALFRRGEYAAAGLQVLPVARGEAHTHRVIIGSSFVLLLASVLPWAVGLGGSAYLVTALACSAAFCGLVLWGRRGRDLDKWARSVFFASMPYLVVLLAVLGVGAP